MVNAFGYDHVPDAKIYSSKVGGRQAYLFNDGGESSEIWMSKFWPQDPWPEVAVFSPADDGQKLAKLVDNKTSASQVLSPLSELIGATAVTIDSIELARRDSHVNRLRGAKLVQVKGTMHLGDGRILMFYTVLIPSSGRFISWQCSLKPA